MSDDDADCIMSRVHLEYDDDYYDDDGSDENDCPGPRPSVCKNVEFDCIHYSGNMKDNFLSLSPTTSCKEFVVENYTCVDPVEQTSNCIEFECTDYKCIETHPETSSEVYKVQDQMFTNPKVLGSQKVE